jgi:N utilization substance protein B
MGVRHQSREAALQILYLADVAKMPVADATAAILAGFELPDSARDFAAFLAKGADEKRAELDQLISTYAENWEIGRMAAVDRNILRLAAFELLHYLETPFTVVIDEAVEIAKSFSTQDSGKFVNAILDKINKQDRPADSPHDGGPTPA